MSPTDWAEQLCCYPLIQGEARWAVEALVAHARGLERENLELRLMVAALAWRKARDRQERGCPTTA